MTKYATISLSMTVFLIHVFPDMLHYLRTTKNKHIRKICHDLADAFIYPITFVQVTAIVVKKLINGEFKGDNYKQR